MKVEGLLKLSEEGEYILSLKQAKKISEKSNINIIEKTPFNLRGNINIINKAENDRIIAGYANIAVVDLEDQFIPIETLKKGIETLLKDPHYSNLMLVHQNIQIGKIIPSYGDLETHVDDKGLFIVAEIRRDIKTADEIWKSILDKEINGFSIGCEVLRDHEHCEDKKCITVLDEINIFEVSVCSKPVNENSGFIIVSKSNLDDYVCNKCLENVKEMTKSKKETKTEEVKEEVEEKETKEEEKTEEQPKEEKQEDEEEMPEEELPEEEEVEEWNKSIEDRISNIERSVSSITEIIQNMVEPKEEKSEEIPEETPEEKAEEPPVEEPPKEEEPPEEEEKGAPFGSMDPANQSSAAAPSPDSLEPPAFYKSQFDDLKESIDTLTKAVKSLIDKEEQKLSIKARDDQIEALKEKVKILDKSKEEPKTVQEENETEELEHDDNFIVRRGEVYLKP